MNAVVTQTYTLPDGRNVELRPTAGAKKRIFERFGTDLPRALVRNGDTAIFDGLFALMRDERGNLPEHVKDVTVDWLLENIPSEDIPDIITTVVSAFSNGKKSKNQVETELNQAKLAAPPPNPTTGSGSSPSVTPISESPDKSSGGDSLSAN